MKTLTRGDIIKMSENEKIVFAVKALGAKNLETGVSMEQIIRKGIELGLTEDYITDNWEGYQNCDHPWYPAVAPMMGIGTENEVANKEEIFLHREKVKNDGTKRKKHTMIYWYNKEYRHKVVHRKTRNPKKVTVNEYSYVIDLTLEEKIAKMEANPGMYRIINEKLIDENWIQNNPEKAKKLYGKSAL